MARIKDLGTTMIDAIVLLVDGNPGAIRAIQEMTVVAPRVDPQSTCGAWGPIINLDMFEIYGSHIWMLYKDVCGEDAVKAIALLRAVQLGALPVSALRHGIDHRGDGLDVPAILQTVQERLPEFWRAEPESATHPDSGAPKSAL